MAAPYFSSCIIKLNSSTEDKGITVNVKRINFLSLEMERIWGDSANKFTLKLLDDTAYELEAILLGGSRNIYMKYYVEREDKSEPDKSKEFSGNIWDYTIDFINNKVVLTITGTCGVSVKDIYDVYSYLWNKVPTLRAENFTEHQLRELGSRLFWRDKKDSSYADLIFRDAVNENGESSFQVSFSKNDKNQRLWYDCDMIYLPVRPSDIIKLMIYGGSLYSKFSPERNTNIDYDKFAESGFNFGTDNNGNTITYKMARNFETQNGVDTRNGTPAIYQWADTTLVEINDLNLLKAAVSTELMNEYLMSMAIDPCGWEYGEIVETEPICADFSQVKMSNTKYINEVLINKSISSISSGQVKANYSLYFDENNKVYYRPNEIKANPTIKATFGQYLNPRASKKGSSYGTDMIVSFSYSSNIAAYIAGESSTELAGINYTTGESLDVSGLSVTAQDKLGLKEGAYTAFPMGKLKVLRGESSTNIDVLIAKAQDDWTAVAQSSFKAEIQILGNTHLECGDYIEIINLPGGPMGKHHTSGVYLIMKIKESITKGLYLSTLSLVKNAASAGSGKKSENNLEKGVIVKGQGSGAQTSSLSNADSSGGFSGGGAGRSFAEDTSSFGSSGSTSISTNTKSNNKSNTKTSEVVKTAVKVAAVTTGNSVAVQAVALGVKTLVNGIKSLFK